MSGIKRVRHQDTAIQFLVSTDLRDEFKEAAYAANESYSAILRQLMREYVEKYQDRQRMAKEAA